MNTLRAALVVVLLIVFTQTLLTQADSTDTFDSDDQNAIKNVVEAYFESRYRAMNTLQLENLDALIAESTEGETDMREELDKLEVEIQHAILNHLRYREYKYYLDYIDISIDTNTQTATVAVSEGHDVVFEVSIEINGSQPAVSSMRNLEHIIVLKKEDGIWKIVSDYYRDYLWRLIEATGISKEELLQSLIVTPIESLENDFPESITACSLSYDESIHPYTRYGAVAYAHKWATAPRPYNSPPYDDFTALMGIVRILFHKQFTREVVRQWYLAAHTVLDKWGGITIVYMIELLIGTMLMVLKNLSSLSIFFGLLVLKGVLFQKIKPILEI